MAELKVGSAVKLAGGGPAMTVVAPGHKDDQGPRWYCEWYVEAQGKFNGQDFPAAALVINAYA